MYPLGRAGTGGGSSSLYPDEMLRLGDGSLKVRSVMDPPLSRLCNPPGLALPFEDADPRR